MRQDPYKKSQLQRGRGRQRSPSSALNGHQWYQSQGVRRGRQRWWRTGSPRSRRHGPPANSASRRGSRTGTSGRSWWSSRYSSTSTKCYTPIPAYTPSPPSPSSPKSWYHPHEHPLSHCSQTPPLPESPKSLSSSPPSWELDKQFFSRDNPQEPHPQNSCITSISSTSMNSMTSSQKHETLQMMRTHADKPTNQTKSNGTLGNSMSRGSSRSWKNKSKHRFLERAGTYPDYPQIGETEWGGGCALIPWFWVVGEWCWCASI